MTKKQAKVILTVGFTILGLIFVASFLGAILTKSFWSLFFLTVSAVSMVVSWKDFKKRMQKK